MKSSKPNKSKSAEKVKASAGLKEKEKVIERKTIPSVLEIREKALEIYSLRIFHGEHGTADEDWLAAENFFRNSEA